MKKYNLTDEQIHKIANLCKQEQGTLIGAKAEASVSANILETVSYYSKKYGSDIYSFMRTSGWFSRAAYWMDNGDASQAYDDAVQDVLCNGNRTLPVFVNEHDSFADIISATNNGKEISIRDRSAYRQDVTVIKNRYGSTYTFWCFPDQTSDPFGYSDNDLRWKSDTVPDHPETGDLLKKAISYLGAAEPTGDDQFIRYYNGITGAGFAMNVAWCAIFVSTIARMIGVSTDIIPTFADCDVGVRWFKNKGRYELGAAYGGSYIPRAGDVVFYSIYYTQSDSTHVGYVVSCDGQSLKAIEGNRNDKVDCRTIELSSKYIIGYGRTAQYMDGDDNDAAFVLGLYRTLLKREPSGVEVEGWVKVLKDGATREEVRNSFLASEEYKALHPEKGDALAEKVKQFQRWLQSYTGLILSVDGSCGAITKQAAVSAMQKYLNSEYYAGLTVDGRFGPKTQAAFRTIKKGTRGTNVYIVQGLLYGHGYDPAGFDGSCGSGCDAAIREFQKNSGLSIDGRCGPATFAALVS